MSNFYVNARTRVRIGISKDFRTKDAKILHVIWKKKSNSIRHYDSDLPWSPLGAVCFMADDRRPILTHTCALYACALFRCSQAHRGSVRQRPNPTSNKEQPRDSFCGRSLRDPVRSCLKAFKLNIHPNQKIFVI